MDVSVRLHVISTGTVLMYGGKFASAVVVAVAVRRPSPPPLPLFLLEPIAVDLLLLGCCSGIDLHTAATLAPTGGWARCAPTMASKLKRTLYFMGRGCTT